MRSELMSAMSNPTYSVQLTAQTSANATDYVDMVWAPPPHNRFVSVAANGTNRAAYSADAQTWTQVAIVSKAYRSLAFSPTLGTSGRLVAVASTGTGSRAAYSDDGGATWTAATTPANNSWYGVCWSPFLSLFVACSITGSGNRIMTTPDGINWTSRTTSVANDWCSIVSCDEIGLLVCVSQTGSLNRVMTSPDGTNWTVRSQSANGNWQSVAWSKQLGVVAAVGTNGAFMHSTDGINWNIHTVANGPGGSAAPDFTDITFAEDISQFLMTNINQTGYRIVYSPNGKDVGFGANDINNDWVCLAWSSTLHYGAAGSQSGTTNRLAKLTLQ